MVKLAQIYGCHELFLKYTVTVQDIAFHVEQLTETVTVISTDFTQDTFKNRSERRCYNMAVVWGAFQNCRINNCFETGQRVAFLTVPKARANNLCIFLLCTYIFPYTIAGLLLTYLYIVYYTYIYQQLTLNTLSIVNTSNLIENLNSHDIMSNFSMQEKKLKTWYAQHNTCLKVNAHPIQRKCCCLICHPFTITDVN